MAKGRGWEVGEAGRELESGESPGFLCPHGHQQFGGCCTGYPSGKQQLGCPGLGALQKPHLARGRERGFPWGIPEGTGLGWVNPVPPVLLLCLASAISDTRSGNC